MKSKGIELKETYEVRYTLHILRFMTKKAMRFTLKIVKAFGKKVNMTKKAM